MDRFTARKATKLKRQVQRCRVYQVKIDYSKLSQASQAHLDSL